MWESVNDVFFLVVHHQPCSQKFLTSSVIFHFVFLSELWFLFYFSFAWNRHSLQQKLSKYLWLQSDLWQISHGIPAFQWSLKRDRHTLRANDFDPRRFDFGNFFFDGAQPVLYGIAARPLAQTKQSQTGPKGLSWSSINKTLNFEHFQFRNASQNEQKHFTKVDWDWWWKFSHLELI